MLPNSGHAPAFLPKCFRDETITSLIAGDSPCALRTCGPERPLF
jgi:hypothetical protein